MSNRRRLHPTHRADQQQAAEAHTALFVERHKVGLPGGGTSVHIEPNAEPEWLRALLATHQAALNGPGALACDHIADGEIGLRCIMAWHPGVLICAQCAASGRFGVDPSTDDEYRCDGCDQVHREGVFATVIQVLPDTTLHLGVCADCRATLSGARS